MLEKLKEILPEGWEVQNVKKIPLDEKRAGLLDQRELTIETPASIPSMGIAGVVKINIGIFAIGIIRLYCCRNQSSIFGFRTVACTSTMKKQGYSK